MRQMIREQIDAYNKVINSDSLEGGRLDERGAIISSLSKFERENCTLYRLKRGEL